MYDKLGFEVEVLGADTAVAHLKKIEERLLTIRALSSKSSKIIIEDRRKEDLSVKRTTKSFSSYLFKLSSIAIVARRLGSFVSSAIKETSDYVENLNLFAVAYGDVYQETLDWALNLADGFGLASNEVLKFAGTFRQLSTSLGLVEDTANSVSQTVTQLGYDLSALFNTSVEKAMDKLQSSIFSGNVRPLRAYGIDISQTQIDALFATNEALASMNVNARNLTQSDKVLARLIITLRDGSNAFGTMNREINTLQSQIRILQGSFSNFKLAVGDLIHEPLKEALIYTNAFLIAITDIIRAFAPLKTEDENAFTNIALGAEEASDEIDNLNGKLGDFDKFNVLGGQDKTSSSAITEALTAELEKQQAIYKAQVEAMSSVANQAKVLAEQIKNFFIVTDENGNFVKWTNNAKALAVALTALSAISLFNTAKSSSFLAFASMETGDSIAKIAEISKITSKSTINLANSIQSLSKVFSFLTSPLGIILTIVGVLYATNEEFRNSINGLVQALTPLLGMSLDLIVQVLKPIIPLVSGLVNILGVLLSFIVKIATGIVYLGEGVLIAPFAVLEFIIKGLSTIIVLLETLFNWNWSALGEKMSKLWNNWAVGDLSLNVGSGLSSTVRGFADGGYSNANLIMTHENGKREAVMKQGKSNVIMNDMQMTDIMEVAVARGVYNALSARGAMNGDSPTNETIVVKIGEEEVFTAVKRTAKRKGLQFANV